MVSTRQGRKDRPLQIYMQKMLEEEEVEISRYNHPDHGIKKLSVSAACGSVELITRDKSNKIINEFSVDDDKLDDLIAAILAAKACNR